MFERIRPQRAICTGSQPQLENGDRSRLKHVLRSLLATANLVPSRTPPFVSRRYPFKGQSKMLRALGDDLSAPTTWREEDFRVSGVLGPIFEKAPSVHKWWHYLPIYESVITNSQPIRMLEIGVFHGGSLRMWHDYLYPGSTLVGIDINPECKQFDDPEHNIHVRIGGQQDKDFLQAVNEEFGPFDVILDDGSHMTSHMIASFQTLFGAALAEPGVYIVEDMHSNYWKSYRDSSLSFIDLLVALIDAMHAHYPLGESELYFRQDNPRRLREVSVPRVTPMLAGIEVYDSVAVIRKASRQLPRSVYH